MATHSITVEKDCNFQLSEHYDLIAKKPLMNAFLPAKQAQYNMLYVCFLIYSSGDGLVGLVDYHYPHCEDEVSEA